MNSEPHLDNPTKEKFMQRLRAGETLKCSCCGQTAKMYKRRINTGAAKSLIKLYKIGGSYDYYHTEEFCDVKTGADFSLSRHWGLTEPMPIDKSNTKTKASGKWRLTSKGIDFVQNKIRVPCYTLIYNDKLYGFDGGDISIVDALASKFNYGDLMAAKANLA